ncbi:hypothetical protein L1887_19618 [Cichorium endivia]|nr:hypothetical protein L1887_19618 [Cichorium endivia]
MLQGKDVKHLEIPLTDIKTATKNFSKAYLIGSGTYGDVYKAEIDHFDSKNFLPLEQKIDNGERPKKRSTAAIKLIKIRQDQQGEEGFHAEIEMLTSFVLFEMLSGRLANDPIYINENENGIAHVARRRFNDRTIKDMCVAETQAERPTAEVIIKKLEEASSFQEGNLEHLEIPLSDILSATENFAKTYLIGSGIHGEMYKAEVDHFDSASFLSFEKKYQVCFDSEHDDTGELKYDTDIYSFGVVLFEIMSGRFAHDPIYTKENSKGIVPIACRHFNEGTIREMVDPVLMEETHVNTLYKGPGEDSLEAFSKIAYQCVTEHPVVEVILKKLEEALYFQEDYEMWEPKLPSDYKQIIGMSNSREIYSTVKKKDLYDILSKGILLQEGKLVQQLLMKSDLKIEQVQQFSNNLENYDEGKKLLLLNGVNKKKHYMLPAKEALYKSSDVKLFNLIPSTQSRLQDVIELQRQQVFCIKYKIESQRLSPNTEYACYIVFKLSEKCHGLHCPVIVRDLLKRKNKEKRIIYFRSPNPCNVYDTDRVPEEREDGWMEVNVWQFNSSNKLRDNCVSINLKLISYEGTMHGLIVNGIEFRPM